jgi:hypothetical protein
MSRLAGQNSRVLVGQGLASLVLLISAIWLPWATYRSPGLSVTLTGGRLGLVLLAAAAGSLGLAAAARRGDRDRKVVHRLQLVLSGAALICSLVMALSKIAEVNRLGTVTLGHPTVAHGTGIGTGAATTSYGIGAGLALAASVALVVSSGSLLRSDKVPATQKKRRRSEPAELP